MSNAPDTALAIQDGRGQAMLSVDDVAKFYLNCSTRTVTRLADLGRMPQPIKLCSLVWWPRSVIEQRIAKGCPNGRNIATGGRK